MDTYTKAFMIAIATIYYTIGDLDDLATMLTIANMMTMMTTVDQISKLIIRRLFHAFSAYKTMYHALY